MQTRHSIQIKQLLQKKSLSKSRFNPESRIIMVSPSMKQSRQLKKSQSSNSLHVQQQKYIQLQIMQKRYKDLYKEYVKIAEQAKKRAQLCKRQEQQITKYTKACQRDKKQIQRLRSMVGFLKKCDNCTQTTCENQSMTSIKQFNILAEKKSASKQKCLKDSRKVNFSKTGFSDYTIKKDIRQVQNIIAKSRQQSRGINGSKMQFASQTNLKHYDSQSRILKKFQSSKLGQSLTYGNKTTVDFKKRKTHVQNNSETNISNDAKYSRVNSPNSKYKFIPSVEI